MKNILLHIVLTVSLLTSCNNHIQNDLEKALLLSGENRTELERVLTHYSEKREDSLKLKAAIFLIENMPGHYSYYGIPLNKYREAVEEDEVLKKLPWHIRNIYHYFPYRNIDRVPNTHRIEDVKCITADYLINNIDHAFKAWERPWARHFGFEDFCEYLLPYRVGNEPLVYWRDSLAGIYADALADMEGIDEIFESPYQACLQINDCMIREFQQAKRDSVSFTHSYIGTQDIFSMNCPEFVYGTIFVMRSLGICVSIEQIEQWSSRSGKHFWNAVFHFTGLHYPFTGYDTRPRGLNQDYKINKVFRQIYSINKESLFMQHPKEPIPPFFENTFLRDVTSEYMTTHSIEVNLLFKPVEQREYAYLCVFDNEKWQPVHWGKIDNNKVVFTDVGPQTMFVAGYYLDNQIVPASLPFHVDLNGNVNDVKCNDERTNITLTRKYPLLRKFANFSRHFIGATIETSAYRDFRQVDTLCVFMHDANTSFDSIYIEHSHKTYRYVRLKNNKEVKLNLAEIEFYETDTTTCIYGKLMPSPEMTSSVDQAYQIFNKSMLDFVEITDWIGIDFLRNVDIRKIRYLPRTDDNNIYPGDTYELFYYDDGKLVSLEQIQASGYSVTFENVPSDCLYLLKNKTKGREHRIFTYKDKKVLFW